MLKTLDVVAAIIEKDDKILLAQRPAHADQPGMSGWTISLEEEAEIRMGGNSFLHNNVD